MDSIVRTAIRALVLTIALSFNGVTTIASARSKELRCYSMDSTLFRAIDFLLSDWYDYHSDHNQKWSLYLKSNNGEWIVHLMQDRDQQISEEALGYTSYHEYCLIIYGEISKDLFIASKTRREFLLLPKDHLAFVYDPPEVRIRFRVDSDKIGIYKNNLKFHMP